MLILLPPQNAGNPGQCIEGRKLPRVDDGVDGRENVLIAVGDRPIDQVGIGLAGKLAAVVD